MKQSPTPLSIAFLVSIALLVACSGTFDIQVQSTPGAEATIVALEVENTRLVAEATQQAQETSRLGRLAYVQSGDIWVRALPDGEPQRLTTDGRNGEPRWSPSGEWLAFRKGDFDQVWMMRGDGENAHPLNEGIPVDTFAWSPVGDRLAYVDLPNGELHVQDVDAAHPTTLVEDTWVDPATPPPEEKWSVGEIVWSPDGSAIAYTLLQHARDPDEASGPPSYQGLWAVSAEGGEREELHASGVPERGTIKLSGSTANGEYLLFWQGEILSASALADGVPVYALTGDGEEPHQLMEAVLYHRDFVVPAPTGPRVALVAGGGRSTWNNKRIAVVQPATGEGVYLTSEEVAALSPNWSPDGSRLAYSAGPATDDVGGEPARQAMMARRIWLVDVDGTRNQQLTDDPAYRDEYPLWSADGSHILFVRLDAEDRVSLWLLSVGDGEPQRVVEELTPAPEWFGYYGYIGWHEHFDWWLGAEPEPVTPSVTPVLTPTPEPASGAFESHLLAEFQP